MKNIKIIITFLLLSLSVKAQNVPYEKLESFSKEISQLQFEANGKSYNDGTNDIEISFPEENFTVSFESQLATNVVYIKKDNKELMHLTENFSLARVVGFTSEVMDNIVVWKVNFGKFTVTTQVFEDGKLINTTVKNEMILYSYINTNRKASDPTFFKSFSELCNTMKKSIGMITDKELESENKDWENKNNTMVDFVSKYPNSVRTMQAKKIIARNEEKLRLQRIEDERLRLIQVEKDKIEEEKHRVQYEIDEKKRKKIERHTGGGFGYYAGVNSLIGFSFSGVEHGFGYGLDVRVSDYFVSTKTVGYKEQYLDISISGTKKTIASAAGLLQLNHPIIYPFYIYVGAGYGFREEVLINNELESKFLIYEQKGIETEGGFLIKTGKLGALRAGISYNSFKLPEYTFGYVFFF